MQTLVIASVASATASFLASRLWGAGTLISAAVTPVVVTLVSEFLRRPVEQVSSVAKTPSIHGFAASRRSVSRSRESARFAEEPEQFAEEPPVEGESTASGEESATSAGQPAEAAGQRAGSAQGNEIHIYSPRRRWRLALITGLAAFVIVLAVYTLTDLLTGQAITGSGAPTTFFGGGSSSRSSTTSSSSTSPTTTTVTKTTTTATSSKPSSTSSTGSTSSSSSRTSPTTSSTSSSTSSGAAGAPAPNTGTAIGQ
jgi:hypothetical protein